MTRSSQRGVVADETLVYQAEAQEISVSVDSPAWLAWLERAHSFSFRSDEGAFTAHKARSSNHRGGWYWYAYRRRRGQLFRTYLGASSRLTRERLRQAARQLALRGEASGGESPVPGESSSTALPPRPSQHAHSALLATKFHLPRLPVHYIARSRLGDALDRGVEARLTLVSAPAGSGKTTLLAAWARATAVPVAWLSLEEADDDPQRFLSYLVAALSHLDTPIDERDIVPTQIDRAHSWEEVLTSLVNELAQTLTGDTVLILDDYHLITSELIHAMLRFLIEHAPASLHLLIGTRSAPPLPVARLRAQGQLRELGSEQLRFSATEMHAFLRAMELELSAEARRAIEEQTQGWIVGVHLLTLALRGHADPATLLQTPPSVHRFFLEYVSEEILAQQPPHIRSFLLHTGILERLTDSLGEAVTGRPDSPRLAELYRGNLLLQALDDTGTWYRYHPLFAEALRAHLHKHEPELVPELYRRASRWYEQQHCTEEACEYAFLAGDLPRAAKLLAELVPRFIVEGRIAQMRQWLTRLSPELIAASPQLWFASVWTRCSEGTVDKIIKEIEQQIELRGHDAGSPWSDLPRELAFFQVCAALLQDDLPRMIALVQETTHVPPGPDETLSHLIAVHQRIALSDAYRENGDLDAAEGVLLDLAHTEETSAKQLPNLLAKMRLADLYEARGELHKLELLHQELFAALDRVDNPSSPNYALIPVRWASLLYEWNRIEAAKATTHQVLELTEHLDRPLAQVALFCLWTLARIARAQGDDDRARHLLERADGHLAQWPNPEQSSGHWDTISARSIPARLALLGGRLEQAEQWAIARGIRFDDPLKPRLLSCSYGDYVTLARILLARGRSSRHASSLAQALTLLDHLRQAVAAIGYTGWSIEVQILTALVLQAQGKTKRALETLGPILAQAEPQGYVRLFADEGQPMAHLLAQVAAFTSASPSYIQRLQKAVLPTQDIAPARSDAARHQRLLDPLSVREQEVLRLLAAGYTNQHIAQQLVISLHTVKLHVKHILAKLSVTNRTQAVARARELHLL